MLMRLNLEVDIIIIASTPPTCIPNCVPYVVYDLYRKLSKANPERIEEGQ